MKNRCFEIAIGYVQFSDAELKQLTADFHEYSISMKLSPLLERYGNGLERFRKDKRMSSFQDTYKVAVFNSAVAHATELRLHGKSPYNIAIDLVEKHKDIIQKSVNNGLIIIPDSICDEYANAVSASCGKYIWNEDANIRNHLLSTAWAATQEYPFYVHYSVMARKICSIYYSRAFTYLFAIYSIIPFFAITFIYALFFMSRMAIQTRSFSFGIEITQAIGTSLGKLIHRNQMVYHVTLFVLATYINYHLWQYFFG